MSTFKERTLINVSEHIEKKGNFNYLSWVYAIDELQKLDDTATWEFVGHTVYPDESVMVSTTVTAFGKTIPMNLPVMNNYNKAIKNPDAFSINTGYMRCLAKNIASHGLGLYIYAGEDLPEPTDKVKYISEEQGKKLGYECSQVGIKTGVLAEHFKISRLSELRADQMTEALEFIASHKTVWDDPF